MVPDGVFTALRIECEESGKAAIWGFVAVDLVLRVTLVAEGQSCSEMCQSEKPGKALARVSWGQIAASACSEVSAIRSTSHLGPTICTALPTVSKTVPLLL